MKRKHHVWKVASITCFALLIAACGKQENQVKDPAPLVQEASAADVIAHGKYLLTIMGCNDCHSPKRMGPNGPEIIPELLLSGYPADRPIVSFTDPMIKEGFGMFYPDLTAGAGPWGISFAGNLTPDETGLGNWTEAQFKIALTQGKFKGMENGRMLLPPMPWTNFVGLKDADIHALFTYLQSIQPVSNIVPPPIGPENM